jgi:hypothetical protein
MTKYETSSLYQDTEISDRFLGYYVHTKIEAREDDHYVEVDHRWTHRPDLLAHDLYGDAKYWYVIPMRNGFEDPYFDLTYGRTIIIPNKEYIENIFG